MTEYNTPDNTFECINMTFPFTIFMGHTPAKVYGNLYHNRSQIRADHKGKVSAIYLLYNLSNPSMYYVGATIGLAQRINQYLNNSYLTDPKNNGIPICKALLKYGQAGFGLIVIEYLSVDNLNTREVH